MQILQLSLFKQAFLLLFFLNLLHLLYPTLSKQSKLYPQHPPVTKNSDRNPQHDQQRRGGNKKDTWRGEGLLESVETANISDITTPLCNSLISNFSYNSGKAALSSFNVNPDTGTSGHFFSISDRSCLLDVLPAKVPHQVFLPDGSSVFSTHTARLNLPNLPSQATIVHVFPHWIGSLLSIGLLCDAGCTAKFTADGVTITDSSDTVILHGHRSQLTRMWTINLTPPPSISAVVITEPQGTYASQCCWFLSRCHGFSCSIFSRTKEKHIDFPGLTLEIATKYMPGHTPLEELIYGVKQLGQALRNCWRTLRPFLVLCSLDALHDAFPRPPVIVVSPSVQPDLSQSLRVEPASDHYAALRVAPFDPHQVIKLPWMRLGLPAEIADDDSKKTWREKLISEPPPPDVYPSTSNSH